jgi:hypothetical protein
VTGPRPDLSRRATPELVALYKRRALRLRAENCRNNWRALSALLTRIVRRR